MHFNIKIASSVIAVLLLASCSSEERYKAESCVDCLPNANQVDNNDEDVNSQTTKKIKISVTQEDNNVSWTKAHIDQASMGLVHQGQKAVVYTKWHNQLIVIDPETKSVTDQKLFLDISGGRDVVDSVSGASEQVLEKVTLSSDSSMLYAMVTKYADDNSDIGVGVYSTEIENGIPDLRFASQSTVSETFYHEATIRDIALSSDGNTLLSGGDDRKIKIFANGLNNPDEIDVGKKIRSLSFSEQDSYIFCGLGGLTNLVRIYDASTKTLLSEMTVDETPLQIVEVSGENKMVVLFADSNKVRVYDITDIRNPVQSRMVILNGKAKSVILSDDSKLFAVSATGKKVNLCAVEGGQTPEYVITTSETVSGASFSNNEKLIVSGESAMLFYDLNISYE
ncbi:MAG: hypothetical protein K0U47_01675 [Epsilonproteobacteria bacterium]|nr:hypothetical protein [Campylobacterota bacterium]